MRVLPVTFLLAVYLLRHPRTQVLKQPCCHHRAMSYAPIVLVEEDHATGATGEATGEATGKATGQATGRVCKIVHLGTSVVGITAFTRSLPVTTLSVQATNSIIASLGCK